MEFGIDLLGRQHANRRRQQPVHGAHEILQRNRIVHRDRRHLRQRVNTRIGASRSRDVDRLLLHAADNLFEHSLDRGKSRLHLPAVKPGAVVGDRHANAA